MPEATKRENDHEQSEHVGMTDHAKEPEDRPNELHFLVREDEEAGFFAVCIERYIGAQGRTVEEALARLRVAYRAELDESMRRTGKPFDGIPEAPDEYRQAFDTNDGCLMRGIIYDSLPQNNVLQDHFRIAA